MSPLPRALPALLVLAALGAAAPARAQTDPPGTIRLAPPPGRPEPPMGQAPAVTPPTQVRPVPPGGPTIPGVTPPAGPGRGPAPGPAIPGGPPPAASAPDGGAPPGPTIPGAPPAPGSAPGAAPAPAAPAPAKTAPARPAADLKPGWTPHAGAAIDLGGQKRVFVGDVFQVKVTVITRVQVPVNLPGALDLGDFSLVGREPVRTERLDGDKVKHTFVLRVSAFNVGEIALPAIPVTYVPPREAFAKPLGPGQPVPVLVVTTAPLRQRISSVLANEPQPQLKKNAPPMTILVEDRRMRTAMIVLVALLIGAALGFVIFWALRNRLRQPPPPPPPRPADEIALEKLAAIRAADYLTRGELKEYYLAVSEAIREYLGNRYGFDSLEMTTTELEDQLRKVTLTGLSFDDLMQFLRDCDLVKFAKYIPPHTEAEQILARAEHIVHATRYVPPARSEEDDEDDDAPPAAQARRPPPQAGGPAREVRHG